MGMKNTYLLCGDDNTDESLSLLGLKSGKERELRVHRVNEAKASVFVEQVCQEERWLSLVEGEFRLNQETIAEFYSIHSKKAALIAYMRGMHTAQHIEEPLNDDCENDCENNDMRGMHTARHIEEPLNGACENNDCENNARHPSKTSKKLDSALSWDKLKYSPPPTTSKRNQSHRRRLKRS
jgi:hypothetical protein